MVARTYVDALGAMRAWINSRTATLVGEGMPLQGGAHLKYLQGSTPITYAYLEELTSVRSADSPESPDMMAMLSAQVFGGTREAATTAAVALAEEISTQLCGCQAAVPGAVIFVSDDITGPSWFPDGGLPRLLVQWTTRVRPA
jgi:hypothetical protein